MFLCDEREDCSPSSSRLAVEEPRLRGSSPLAWTCFTVTALRPALSTVLLRSAHVEGHHTY